MEPPDIERLDERTVQRIAAGEVVERPASVVKELVENSLDAGASRVAVSVESGGTEGIRVRDDGVGIPEDQLEAAVAEHATSKIGDIEDLDRGVGTLGFRGEALYTVGAVSRLTVRSRPPGAEAGAEITVEGGEVGEVRPAGCPTGTTVEVDDLFYNTPAREKFLKRTATEFDHVNTVVTGYALANPDVAVSLEHDGRETFATEGNGDLRSAVLAVYGREVAESMIDIDWTPEGETGEDTPIQRVTGLVSHPETARSTRDYLSTYVNGRYVTASALREATLDAYGGQLAPDRYPFAVLFVEVPAGDVDVNVHPRKLEVRFDEESAVRSAVETAVAEALLDHGLIRSTAPRGQSAPDETAVDPETPDVEAVGGADTDHERTAREGRESPAEATEPDGSTETADRGRGGDSERTADSGRTADESRDGGEGQADGDAADPASPTELDPDDDAAWAVDDLGGGANGGVNHDAAGDETGGVAESATETVDRDAGSPGTDPSTGAPSIDGESDRAERSVREGPPTTEESGSDDGAAAESAKEEALSEAGEPEAGEPEAVDSEAARLTPGARPPTRQRTLDGEATEGEREFDSLPSLRVLGQLHETYVVAEAPDGLVLIDQHAADERVNYERLKATVADGADGQALAEPVRIELTAREAALFEEFVEDLAGIGFRAERAGEREVAVTAVPAVFDAALDPNLLRDALSALVDDAAAGDEPVADAVDELLADLACYPSVTGNSSLTEGRVVDLLDRLDACDNPYACPHGRPVVIRLDRDEIGSRFERDYPGHGGRRAE